MYGAELSEARQTLNLSDDLAGRFLKNLGAIAPILLPPLPTVTLGRKPGFQATVLDQKYWFAKLYALVTYQEISYSLHTRYPGYSLHFIKVFYGMYYQAMQRFLAGKRADVDPLWVTHFSGPQGKHPVEPASQEAVEFSVRTGATAHIQHDMPIGLATAYKAWKASPKPAFGDLRNDFMEKSEGAFIRAQAAFYIEVNDKIASPFRPEVGQLGAAYYQALFNIQPSLPVMFQWRRDAWKKAEASLN